MTTSSNMSEDEAASQSIREENQFFNATPAKVFKKSTPNNNMTLFLGTRELIISDQIADKIRGIVFVDPEFLGNKKVFGQITLTFRYGREDEEVMGLKFCNEAIMCIAQLYPAHPNQSPQVLTSLQEALIRRFGSNAHPFTMEITHLAPPSVQLVPAKEYNGAPIGTSYDIRAFVAEKSDEKQNRKNTVRMGIRVIQRPQQLPTNTPRASITRKPFILSHTRVKLEATLNKAVYTHGDTIKVHVSIKNDTKKYIRRLKILIIQHVDVCMFSNGKFKNIVAMIDAKDDCPMRPGTPFQNNFQLNPAKGVTKNWIALEETYLQSDSSLAGTIVCNSIDERNVFAIYVSYYVKVRIVIGAIGRRISVKLPFTLLPSQSDTENFEPLALSYGHAVEHEKKQEKGLYSNINEVTIKSVTNNIDETTVKAVTMTPEI